jgi:cyclic pyranopterin phosphate synthase
LLDPLHRRDRTEWTEVRSRNRQWLGPWDATSPDKEPTYVSFPGLVRHYRTEARAGRMLPLTIRVDSRIAGQMVLFGISYGSLLSAAAVAALRDGTVPKGDALAVARIAGIQAVKRTPELIPLAHPVAVHAVEVDLEVADDGVDLAATVRTADRTGIEMEALTAVSIAALALIDMVKAVDKHARITDVRVTAKSGGRSGDWVEGS